MSLPIELPTGLPPLPKILSTDTKHQHQNHLIASNGRLKCSTSIALGSTGSNSSSSSISRTNSLASTNSSNSTTNLNNQITTQINNATLNNQLTILQKEMYELRQLDLSLLSQLWSLNESIQEYRAILQEDEMLSPPTPSDSESDDESVIMSQTQQYLQQKQHLEQLQRECLKEQQKQQNLLEQQLQELDPQSPTIQIHPTNPFRAHFEQKQQNSPSSVQSINFKQKNTHLSSSTASFDDSIRSNSDSVHFNTINNSGQNLSRQISNSSIDSNRPNRLPSTSSGHSLGRASVGSVTRNIPSTSSGYSSTRQVMTTRMRGAPPPPPRKTNSHRPV